MRGTATRAVTRSLRMVSRTRPGASSGEKTAEPPRRTGMNRPRAWPNMWLSGRRFRMRTGWKGRRYGVYPAISLAMGPRSAQMFLCLCTTPLGRPVVPEV